jgi:hypothetical protein
MAKEKIVFQYLKYFFLLYIGFSFFPHEIRGAVNPESVIVSNAIGYLGRSYSEIGEPLNKEREYGGGGIIDYDWGGAVDCSGLVSLCAGLRRHYFVSTGDMDLYTNPINWESLRPGDLLLGSKHVLIFEKWVFQEGTDTNSWKVGVIHASYSKKVVRRDIFTVLGCKTEGWFPRRFKNDTTPPIIYGDYKKGIKFIEFNEKIFNKTVNLEIIGRDYLEGETYAYGLYKGEKFKTKIFQEDGEYEITGKAIDWAKNEKEETIKFGIDKTLPQISITSPSEEEWLNKNSVNIKGKLEDPLKNNYASGQGTCPAPELFYDVYKHHLIV